MSVVLDLAGNAPKERVWAISLIESEDVTVVLHYVKASDELRRRRLQQRNGERPEARRQRRKKNSTKSRSTLFLRIHRRGFDVKENGVLIFWPTTHNKRPGVLIDISE